MIIISCKKEIVSVFEQPLDPKIEWAKIYYERSLEPTIALVLKPGAIMSSDGSKGIAKTNKLTTRWENAIAETTPIYEYVEVPINYEHKLSTTFAITSDPSKAPVLNNNVIKASFDRLVIFKDKFGQTNQRILSYIPDEAYLKKKNGSITHNRVGHMDKDFFGFIQYKTWEGKVQFVLRIENGRPVKRYLVEKKGGQQLTSFAQTKDKLSSVSGTTMLLPPSGGGGENPPQCFYAVSWEWYQDCYYYPDSNIPESCDPPVIFNVQYAQQACDESGGGGGTTDPGPVLSTDCLDDQVFIDGECITIVQDLSEIKLDSLEKYYPCAVKLILNKLRDNMAFSKLVQPFKTILLPNGSTVSIPSLPDLTFDFSSQPYGTNNNYQLGQTTPSQLWDAKIEFNSNALANTSLLFLQSAAIHESGHAYAYFYIKAGSYGHPVDTTAYPTWAMNMVKFEAIAQSEGDGSNFNHHSLFLENYIDNFWKILKALNGSAYTDKQYQMAAMYGMNNPGPAPTVPFPANQLAYTLYKKRLDSTYKKVTQKYGIDSLTRENFYKDNVINVPSSKKLPATCP